MRFAKGPSWSRNSCALDCFLAAALLAEGGRCQADQVDPAFLQEVAPVAALVQVIRKPWSLLSEADISELRDAMRQALFQLNTKAFPLAGTATVHKVFEVLGLAMPQLCTTWSVVLRCCQQGRWGIGLNTDQHVRSQMVVGVYTGMLALPHALLSGLPVQEAVQACLDPLLSTAEHDQPYPMPRCKAEGCGNGTIEQMAIVLDRPPPMLVLGKGFETHKGIQQGMFENLELRFAMWEAQVGDRAVVKYELWGWVKRYKNHFTLYATRTTSGRKDYIYYDGSKNRGRFQEVDSLDFDITGSEGVSCLIYKMIE
jgi:hypothetical protein